MCLCSSVFGLLVQLVSYYIFFVFFCNFYVCSFSAVRKAASCLARTRVPGAARPGWVCPAGTVRTGMGICGQCLASYPDGHSKPSRRRPLCSRWMPEHGADSGGRRLAAASTRKSPGALAGSGSPATGCGWRVCPPCPAAGLVGAARRANRVREYHRILLVIGCMIARIWLSCLASHSCQSSLGDF